jgi:ketosteroid isomerase-like protein
MTTSPVDAEIAAILKAEEERCRAISEQDWDTLASIMADDLSHTHMNGLTQDKPTYLEHVKGKPRTTSRRDLKVRLYGNVAVMIGIQVNTMVRDGVENLTEMQGLQVWVKNGNSWQQTAFQVSRISPPNA